MAKKKAAPHAPLRPVTPDQQCVERAISRGQPTFTLVGQDRTAPKLIRKWAWEAAKAGAPAEKVGAALLDAAAFHTWQVANGSKIPD